MKKLAKAIALTLAVAVVLIMLSCSAAQDSVTPCWISKIIGEYTGEPMRAFMPYTTIADAKRLALYLTYTHQSNQIDFMRLSEDDVRHVGLLQEIQAGHLQRAAQLKDTLFSPAGPGSMLLGMLPMLGIGIAIRRPGDISKKELEKK